MAWWCNGTAVAIAADAGIGVWSVQSIWRGHGFKLHQIRLSKLSNGPLSCGELRDVIGFYAHPPTHTIALSSDEKSRIQAPDRNRPDLAVKPGRCGITVHDYKSDRTTILFAAFDVPEGKIIRCHAGPFPKGDIDRCMLADTLHP